MFVVVVLVWVADSFVVVLLDVVVDDVLERNLTSRPLLIDCQMVDYLSALLSICFMTFLGFTDDVLDLPWR